jgi:septal ring factor EnvC (AmiA/AmiB activator)
MGATLMERITGRRRAAEQKTIDNYRELVAAVADNPDSVDPARADAILLDSAKTPAQLEADVATFKQRRADAELAARLPALRKRAEELAAKNQPLRDKLAEAQRQYQAEAIELDRATRLNDRQIMEAEHAAARLRAGRPDDRIKVLREQKAFSERRRGELVSAIGGNDQQGLRGRLANYRKALKHGPQADPGGCAGNLAPSIVPGLAFDERMLRDAVALTEGELRGLESELKTVDARLAEVNAELAEIEARQLSAV